METPPDRNLNAKEFDRIAPKIAPRPKHDRIVWTAEAIGARIGCSADYVRGTLVSLEGSPVRKIGSRYAAHEGDLIAFFRAQPKQA